MVVINRQYERQFALVNKIPLIYRVVNAITLHIVSHPETVSHISKPREIIAL